MKIQLKRSGVLDGGNAKAPTASQLEYGELAVNYSTTDPCIFLKDSNDAVIRISGAGSAGSFSGDYNALYNKPTIGNGNININAGNGLTASGNNATANQTGDTTRTLSVQAADSSISVGSGGISVNDSVITPTWSNIQSKPTIGNGTITVVQPGTSNQTFTVNQTGNTTITLKNDNTTYSVGDGTITLRSYGHNANFSSTFSTNQTGSETITMPQIRYGDLSGRPTIGNGQINVNVSTGLSVSGSNATANQTGNTTRTLSLNTSYTDGRYLRLSGGINGLSTLP